MFSILAAHTGNGFDKNGVLASEGKVDDQLLNRLNAFSYYNQPYPKSLSNEFGMEEIFPVIQQAGLILPDALRTYVQHIIIQIKRGVLLLREEMPGRENLRLLITGGGAHNLFLAGRLREELAAAGIHCVIPEENLIDFKEALVIALMGALRWREDINVMHSVTGASKDSINGAVWSV
jgi:anhydro-N-acetylmuramic acid kinase